MLFFKCTYYLFPIFFLVHISFGQKSNSIKFTLIENELSGHWVSSITQDKRGLIWIGTQDGLFMYDGKNVTTYRYDPAKKSLPGSFIRSLASDNSGVLWLGVNGFGLVSFNPENNEYNNFSESSYSNTVVQKIFIDSENDIWFQSEYGVFKKHNSTDDYIHVTKSSGNLTMAYLGGENILISKDGILFEYTQESKQFNPLIKNIEVNQIVVVSETEILIRTKNEVFLYDLDSSTTRNLEFPEGILAISNCVDGVCYFLGTTKIHKYTLENKSIITYSINNTNLVPTEINTLFLDKQGVLWIGAKQGLYKENKNGQLFKESIPLHAREIFIDNSTVFVAGRDGFHSYRNKSITPIIEGEHLLAGYRTKQGFWLGDGNGKIHFVNNHLIKVLSKRVQNDQKNSFTGLYGVVVDSNGFIWVGSMGGLNVLNTKGKILKKYLLETENEKIKLNTAKFIDSQGSLWVTTVGNGVYKIPDIADVAINKKPFAFKNYRHVQGDSSTLNSNTIYDIFQDRNGGLWFGTDFGLNKYLQESDSFQGIKKDGNLFNYNIMSINGDNSGYLWISTIRDGIFVYSPEDNIFYNLTEKEGLISNAGLIDSSIFFDNNLYFGTEDGIQVIDPNKFYFPKVESAPLITDFSIIGDVRNTQSIRTYNNETIYLNHKQTDISVGLSLFDYRFPEKINFYYKLNEIHNYWKKAPNNQITFINLQPGKYTLSVKAVYNYERLEDAPTSSMKINIAPIWYKSFSAYIIYALLIIMLTIILYRFNLKRQLTIAEASKTKELDKIKSEMYANISHEFRTPLTLIGGFTSLLLKKNTDELQIQMLQGITNNNKQLLNLVNQMLDLASLDANNMNVDYKNGDIIHFIKKITALYRIYSESRQQSILFEADSSHFIMDFDDDKLQKILNNLLSNALKFTPKNGEIKVRLRTNAEVFRIEVFDSGIGIAPEDLSNIFNRHYKTMDLSQNKGNGIGLALTKELVELLNGSINVKSKEGKGTVFTIELPVHNNAKNTQIHIDSTIFEERSEYFNHLIPIRGAKEHTVLVVEDNKDIRTFIKILLSNLYTIYTAKNGIEGLKIAKTKTIDFIISDVNMPEMDGYEFCRQIKNNINTSHIPFVMVSARTMDQDKIKGYRLGVDAYLTKPFNQEELLLIIKNLLQKKQERVRYLSRLLYLRKEHKKLPDVNELDIAFIKNIQEFALDNTNKISMDALAKQLHSSRAQLHRKVKALTGMSITAYINHIKIEKAKVLLQDTQLQISEIAYTVGFESPNYFSRIFKKELSISPEVYRKKYN